MSFLVRQFSTVPYPTKSFQGQTIIVTGSNIGLGLEAARHFVRLDAAKVILAVRSIAKGEEAAKDIKNTTGKDVCEVWQLDMGNFDSVKAFAKRAASLDRLDAVIENAGVQMWEYSQMEGFETTIAVNVVGTFLLALNLMPILRASGKKTGNVPRLTIIASDVHFWATFSERNEDVIFDALNKNEPKYMSDRYNVSKLLEVFMIRELADKIKSGPHSTEPLILNSANPGWCHSQLSRGVSGFTAVIFYIAKLILARTTETGGRTLVAASAGGEETMGQYMSECAVTEPSEFVRSEEGEKTQTRVYTELMAILEKIQPGISKNI